MLPGPVFQAELLTLARKGRYYFLRTLYGGAILFIIWTTFYNNHYYWRMQNQGGEVSIQEAARIGEELFMSFATTQSIAVLLLTPAMVAGAIADERQRKTLHYLLVSRLTSAEIVLGKLLARVLLLGVFVAAGLPILAILTLFGGIDPNMILLFYLGTFCAIFFLAALAILASTYAKRPRDAVSLSYMAEFCWLFGPSIFLLMAPTGGTWYATVYANLRPVVEFLGCSSPLSFLMGIVRFRANSLFGLALTMMGLQVAMGILFVGLAILRLRPSFRKDGGRGRLWKRLSRIGGRRMFLRPECGDAPMLWKERYVSRTSPIVRTMTFLVMVGLGCFLAYGCSYFVSPAFEELWANGYTATGRYRSREELNIFLRIVMALLGICTLIGTASAASSSLTSEKEEDTWLTLVSTPLTAEEIVFAKLFGSSWGLRWVVAVWAMLLLLGAVLGAIHPIGVVAGVVALATFVAFGGAVGMFFSVRGRTSSRSLLATIGLLLMTNLGVLVAYELLISGSDRLALVGTSPYIEAISLLSYEEFDQLMGPRFYARYMENAAICVGSVVLHWVVAALLVFLAVVRFDALNDRPKSTTTNRDVEDEPAESEGVLLAAGAGPASDSAEADPGGSIPG